MTLADVILDTEEIYFQIGRTIIGRYGKTFEWSLKSRLMGMPWNEACELLIETLELPVSPDEYFQQAKELHVQYRTVSSHGPFHHDVFYLMLFPTFSISSWKQKCCLVSSGC